MFQQQPAQTLAAPRPPPSLFLLLAAMLLLDACAAHRPSATAHDRLQESGEPGQESPRAPTSPPTDPPRPPVYDDVITGGTDPDAIEVSGSDELFGDDVGTSIYAMPPHPADAFPATGSNDDLYGSDPAVDILGSDHIEGNGPDELYGNDSYDDIIPVSCRVRDDLFGGVSDDVIEVPPEDIVPCPCIEAWLAIPGNSDRIFDDPTCNCSGAVFTEDDDSKSAGE